MAAKIEQENIKMLVWALKMASQYKKIEPQLTLKQSCPDSVSWHQKSYRCTMKYWSLLSQGG